MHTETERDKIIFFIKHIPSDEDSIFSLVKHQPYCPVTNNIDAFGVNDLNTYKSLRTLHVRTALSFPDNLI